MQHMWPGIVRADFVRPGIQSFVSDCNEEAVPAGVLHDKFAEGIDKLYKVY